MNNEQKPTVSVTNVDFSIIDSLLAIFQTLINAQTVVERA